MTHDDTLYTMALTRVAGIGLPTALQLYRELGGGRAVYDHRHDVADVLPHCPPRLREALKHWDEPLRRAEAEQQYMLERGIKALSIGDDAYPYRLRECPDAPLVLYYKGSADLNQRYVVSIVGTRHCTAYGQDLIRRLVSDLRQLCPQVLIVSGLAYGADICAHRHALEQGYETVGILAHGLDTLYPSHHEQTAQAMTTQGGLLTEYMTGSRIDKGNFVRRNRIVAGISDATILVESAAKGGGLITCDIARSYNRDVFAFPGAVGMVYSEGCNKLIRNNVAALITSAADFVEAMCWQSAQPKSSPVQRDLFPDLTADEQQVVALLQQTNDLQLNIISVKCNLPVHQATALLFQLEMKGVVRPLAGGMYHLIQ